MADRQVVSVNGRAVLNLRQMYALVQELHATAEFLSFEVYCTGGNAVVTSSTATATATLQETMRTYLVPAAVSPELLEEQAAEGEEEAGGGLPGDDGTFGAPSAA